MGSSFYIFSVNFLCILYKFWTVNFLGSSHVWQPSHDPLPLKILILLLPKYHPDLYIYILLVLLYTHVYFISLNSDFRCLSTPSFESPWPFFRFFIFGYYSIDGPFILKLIRFLVYPSSFIPLLGSTGIALIFFFFFFFFHSFLLFVVISLFS